MLVYENLFKLYQEMQSDNECTNVLSLVDTYIRLMDIYIHKYKCSYVDV